MIQPAKCNCTVPAIRVGSHDVCPVCGIRRPPVHIPNTSNSRATGNPAARTSPVTPQPPAFKSERNTQPLRRPPSPPPTRPAPSDPRDHIERVIGRHFAAVSNRGIVHETNQDYASIVEVDLGTSKAQVAVVCDGVSSAQNSEIASKKAAIAASDSLVRLLKARVDTKDAMRLSIIVADMAIRKMPLDPESELHPPGATIVAAVLNKGQLTVGWIGDSRCYWIDKTGVHLLTHDHSWVNLVVAKGSISQEHAERQPEAHRIFRCIGPIFPLKTNEEQPVEVKQIRVSAPGRVLLCTDGLWNYLSKPEILPKLVEVGQGTPDALTQALTLVDFACAQGGKDNISAAILVVN